MRGLLLRLSTVDAEAEAAVRIIAAFDQLVAQRAEIGGIVRTAAAVAECQHRRADEDGSCAAGGDKWWRSLARAS
jgi:hypothetical protein